MTEVLTEHTIIIEWQYHAHTIIMEDFYLDVHFLQNNNCSHLSVGLIMCIYPCSFTLMCKLHYIEIVILFNLSK